MLIALMCLATALIVSWFLLLLMIKREDWITAAYNKALDKLAALKKLRLKNAVRRKTLAGYNGAAAKVLQMFYGRAFAKTPVNLQRDIDLLQNGKLKGINILTMPGYVLQRQFKAIGRGGIYQGVFIKCLELYGNKYAAYKTKQLLAEMLSYPIIGVAAALMVGAIAIGTGNKTFGLAMTVLGPAIVLTFVYSLYDALAKKTVRRHDAICRQFPSVMSKLALLVTSGMIMERAWKETAYSNELELYQEMRLTSEELENLVSPEIAYVNFINRCNTKETTKLASVIMQNLSYGNATIGALLKVLAREAWQERRHTVKRDSEKANAKLMIPIMLLFLAILMMIMAPIAMNFTVL